MFLVQIRQPVGPGPNILEEASAWFVPRKSRVIRCRATKKTRFRAEAEIMAQQRKKGGPSLFRMRGSASYSYPTHSKQMNHVPKWPTEFRRHVVSAHANQRVHDTHVHAATRTSIGSNACPRSNPKRQRRFTSSNSGDADGDDEGGGSGAGGGGGDGGGGGGSVEWWWWIAKMMVGWSDGGASSAQAVPSDADAVTGAQRDPTQLDLTSHIRSRIKRRGLGKWSACACVRPARPRVISSYATWLLFRDSKETSELEFFAGRKKDVVGKACRSRRPAGRREKL
ncbi:hypothetical protein ALC60_10677 [Trachymyrmex zeteki]|uniref:Uncharacterized protein n=1 Tax=Mycetomoellerius zeteki TaxID=64791 RepID=A0A151WQY7_9HYME|nr:hypothetical protein ALC60_10677 [Trachymyrmex zeteki]